MGSFFDIFPRITYDINKNGLKRRTLMTDVFFRFKFLQSIKNLKINYFYYIIKGAETPEMLADKFYNDVEAHWVILMLNDIIDPHLDWFMDDDEFDKYISKKYGSISAAVNRVHHYERKVATRLVGYKNRNGNDIYSNTTSQIDYTDPLITPFEETYPTIPYEYYSGLADYELEVVETPAAVAEVETFRSVVNCYQYEIELNDKKRSIRILQPESYPQVRREFEDLVASYNPSRRLNLRAVSI
jgi:hypothetical protein